MIKFLDGSIFFAIRNQNLSYHDYYYITLAKILHSSKMLRDGEGEPSFSTCITVL
jgi:hypothetical protein